MSKQDSPNRVAPNRLQRGDKKYKEWISNSNRNIDKYSDLPFTIGKPAKTTQARRDIYFQCDCGNITAVNRNTCGIECGGCKRYKSITEECILTEQDVEHSE